MSRGYRFGYARVSAADQSLERQIEALKAQGIEDSRIFTDKISGVKESRPGLDDMLSRLRPGDSVTVLSFDRAARSTKQLIALAETLQSMGVDFASIKERIDTTTPQGKLFFTISAAFAEFERDMIKQRQAEGIAIAKANGKYRGKPPVDETKLDAAMSLFRDRKSNGLSVREISETTGVSRSTIYREANKNAQG